MRANVEWKWLRPRLMTLFVVTGMCVGHADADVEIYVWDSSGGTIPRPTVPTSTVASGADFSIVLNGTADAIQLIATDGGTDIGHVEVVGAPSMTDDLYFVVAGLPVVGMPARSATVEPGCRHWAGVHFRDSNGATGEDSATLMRSYVGAWVSGSMKNLGGPAASIDCGRVVRLQAHSEQAGQGTIDIPVTAYASGGQVIGRVFASHSITGSITLASAITYPSIVDRIEVGPLPGAAGISGRINLGEATVNGIMSSGPIVITGVEPGAAGIRAGRLGLVYAGELIGPSTQDPVLELKATNVELEPTVPQNATPVNIDASIECHVNLPSGADLEDEWSLVDLRCSGDLLQDVKADTLWNRLMRADRDPTREIEHGIFVRGTVRGDIALARDVLYSSIRASDFASGTAITVGRIVKGGIVASAPTGHLRNVTIGYSDWPGDKGFIAYEEQDVPSLIRAVNIENLSISRMFRHPKVKPQEIRAGVIDKLEVGLFEYGLIAGLGIEEELWAIPEEGISPRDWHFVGLHGAHFGEILWTSAGTSHGTVLRPRVFANILGPFVVDHGVAGIIHALMKESTRAIVIGEGLSSPGVSGGNGLPISERAPGVIILDEGRMAGLGSAGLRGSVVLNAIGSPTPVLTELLAGQVQVYVPVAGADPMRLDFNGDQTEAATFIPTYTTPGAVLGGGSIGVVPFDLRHQDCSPSGVDIESPAVFLDSDFCHYRTGAGASLGATLRYSGPVFRPAGSSVPALSVFRLNGPAADIDVTASTVVDCSIGMNPGAPSRQVLVHSTPEAPLVPGKYYIARSPVGDPAGLMCDTVFGTSPIQTNEFEPYYFTLLGDCNRDGIEDDFQIWEPYADWDGNGRLDECQFYFDNYCVGDFNLDGGVDGTDIEVFMLIWGAGSSRADVNRDGGVDGSDMEAFMLAWQNSCQ